jgi:hypothetical protein
VNTTAELTDEARQILDFETKHPVWKYAGAKESAIRELFAMTATAYYQRLNYLLDDPKALPYAPQTINRLRRVRDQRAAYRRRPIAG